MTAGEEAESDRIYDHLLEVIGRDVTDENGHLWAMVLYCMSAQMASSKRGAGSGMTRDSFVASSGEIWDQAVRLRANQVGHLRLVKDDS